MSAGIKRSEASEYCEPNPQVFGDVSLPRKNRVPALRYGSLRFHSELSISGICTDFCLKQFACEFNSAVQLTTLKLELSMEVKR